MYLQSSMLSIFSFYYLCLYILVSLSLLSIISHLSISVYYLHIIYLPITNIYVYYLYLIHYLYSSFIFITTFICYLPLINCPSALFSISHLLCKPLYATFLYTHLPSCVSILIYIALLSIHAYIRLCIHSGGSVAMANLV